MTFDREQIKVLTYTRCGEFSMKMLGIAGVIAFAFAGSVAAQSVTPVNPGDTVVVTVDPSTMTVRIQEIWNNRTSRIQLLFSSFNVGETWSIEKTVRNNTPEAWTHFQQSLLDTNGVPIPPQLDPSGLPLTPSFQGPMSSSGFTTTQGTGGFFPTRIVSSEGSVGTGGLVTFSYKIHMGGGPLLTSKSFIVSQTIPEPSSWAMLIAGFGLVGVALRRGRMVAT